MAEKFRTFIFLLAFWLVNITAAFACLCDTADFAEEFKAAAAVFTGEYVGAEYRKGIVNESVEIALNEEKKEYEILVLKFQVEKWWKGDLKSEVVLVTDQARFPDGGTMVSDCDLSFKKGDSYLIYAFGQGNKLQTSACSRSASLKKAKNDLILLGAGKRPNT